jgi:hypothetical protein
MIFFEIIGYITTALFIVFVLARLFGIVNFNVNVKTETYDSNNEDENTEEER